jgi:hypothetical protein
MHRLVACLAVASLTACTSVGDPPRAKLRTGPPSLNVADAALAAGAPETALNIAKILIVGARR